MIGLLVWLIILVLIVWAIRMLLPMLGLPAPLERVIYVVLVIIMVLWLLGMIVQLPLPRL